MSFSDKLFLLIPVAQSAGLGLQLYNVVSA